MRLWLITQLWKIDYIRRRWCWADAVAWETGVGSLPIDRVDPACDYCGACKERE